MIVTRATIDGFGKWYDQSIDFSQDSLTCLYGENESGKSTLYQFILFMLFGLPPKKRAFFRPKTGAKMGGRLTIYDEEIGEYTIERFDAARNGAALCYTGDGNKHDEEWLKNRLQGMTFPTYQSIFSFSAADLFVLNEMKEEDLGDVLLSIGLTGSRNIQAIEKRLDAQLAELFKPYGKKPIINKQIATLDELHTSLSAYEKDEAAYRDKKEKLDTLETEIGRLKIKLHEEKSCLSAIEKKLHALPLIHQYHHYAKQLAVFPDAIPFPKDVRDRYNVVKEQLLPLQSEYSGLAANLTKYRAKTEQLKETKADEATYKQVKQLLEQSAAFLDIEKELNKLREAQKQKEMQITTLLNQLNTGITLPDLASITLTFHTEETWNSLAGETNQLELEWNQQEQEERVAKRQRDELQTQQEELKSHLLPEQRVGELTATIRAYQQQTDMMNDTSNQREWQQMKSGKEKSANTILAGSLILAMLNGIGLLFFDNKPMLGIMLITLIIGFGQWFFRKHSIKETERMLQWRQAQFPEPAITQKTYEEAESLLAFHTKNETDLAVIQDQLQSVDVQFLKLSERRNALDVKQDRINQQMEQQYDNYPFLCDIDISYWVPFYHSLKNILQLHEEAGQMEHQQSKLRQKKAALEQNINRFFQERNGEALSGSVEAKMIMLENLARDYQQANDLIAQYNGWIKENIEEQEIVEQKMAVYQKERERLYQAADVKTEEAFFQKAKEWEEKQKISTRLAEITDQLLSIFAEEELERIKTELLIEHELKEEQETHTAAIQRIESELDAKRQELADRNADLARMESSVTYSSTLHRFCMEQEQLAELARKWAVLKTAKELLADTKRNYREKYITKVIEKTSAYFAELTNNAYKEVFAPTEGQLFQVVSANDIHYTVNELSQGTTDQLYVSLRIAISEVMSEKHRLPFIIDDAFVHFDLYRTKNIMRILTKIAESQQVILLTCKKDLKDTVYNGEIVYLENTVRIS
ncbi:hypothetical protein GCM10011409_31340 [Lentibacillus populi]|uniref:YhaN AAA domain-containing protein n=1 Tax=Lentibacillus populi TaxID=1827502 RepID=A0A9W5X6J0_9BACI|nr:AAA family ATPase [Lentibacillus populi]GGB51518.1 hypothetical protein GCM10011409_31340 [Lentibacillus populi]